MKKILMVSILWALAGAGVSFAASPSEVVELAPYSNMVPASGDVAKSTAATSGVSISSSTAVDISAAFAAVATSALGANYNQAELVAQNNDSTVKYCGYSPIVTVSTSFFKIAVGDTWTFKLGKGIKPYCLNAAGAAGTLTVGGVAWK